LSWLLTFPILIPIGVAIAVYFLSGRPKAIRRASILGAAALFVVAVMLFIVVLRAGVIAGQMGDWPAPFGVTLVADLFSAVMVLIAAVIGLCVAVYALADIDDPREAGGFHAFFHVMLAGVCGAFVAGDLFNLYVWFEVMLIASFALLVLGGEKAQLDGAVKYVALNLISTVFFLTGIGLLYGVTGTLNLAELSRVVAGVDNPAALNAIAVMFIVAFGVKAAMFPLFFWLPASYHTPPVAVTAVFAALLTKVGVYALIRMFTLVFPDKGGFAHELLLIIAILTMTTGVLGAAAQSEFRKILSFHIVSQIGYLILGLAIYSPLAIAGAVYFMVHNIVAKTNLFLVSGAAARLAGDFELQRIGCLYKTSLLLAALFAVYALGAESRLVDPDPGRGQGVAGGGPSESSRVGLHHDQPHGLQPPQVSVERVGRASELIGDLRDARGSGR